MLGRGAKQGWPDWDVCMHWDLLRKICKTKKNPRPPRPQTTSIKYPVPADVASVSFHPSLISLLAVAHRAVQPTRSTAA
jgi:hypothetical protein